MCVLSSGQVRTGSCAGARLTAPRMLLAAGGSPQVAASCIHRTHKLGRVPACWCIAFDNSGKSAGWTGGVDRCVLLPTQAFNELDDKLQQVFIEEGGGLRGWLRRVLPAQVFNELDDKLQQAFMDFLSERGVNAELGQFIVEFSDDKEQREYMHWLEGVHSFLKT